MTWEFDRTHPLVTLEVRLTGPQKSMDFLFAVDTGATHTFISVEALHLLDYKPEQSPNKTLVTTGCAKIYSPVVTIAKIEALGQSRDRFPATAVDLPDTSTIDGLIGLDFLREHVLTIDFRKGLIHLD